jgi:hypothetical protein
MKRGTPRARAYRCAHAPTITDGPPGRTSLAAAPFMSADVPCQPRQAPSEGLCQAATRQTNTLLKRRPARLRWPSLTGEGTRKG